jgi:hypothetical protein
MKKTEFFLQVGEQKFELRGGKMGGREGERQAKS